MTRTGIGRIRIGFRTKRQARAIADALAPEASHPAGERAQATISAKGSQLTVHLFASDSATLRAIVTSHLRMLKAALAVLQKIDQSETSTEDDKR